MTEFRKRELVPYFGVKWLNERAERGEVDPTSNYFRNVHIVNAYLILGSILSSLPATVLIMHYLGK